MKSALPGRESGVSLIEMMVALSIGLLLTLSIGYIFSGSLNIFRVQGENAGIQETGRYLMETLGRQITQAGYAAITTDYNDTKTSFTPADISIVPLTGDDGNTAASAPRKAERKAGSDYLAVAFDSAVDCMGNVVASGTTRNEFYLNNSDQLMCASTAAAGQVLSEGVETFQVLYGVDDNADGDSTVNQVGRYYATPPNGASGTPDYSPVLTVRVCVVVRARSAGTSPTAQRYQDCSGVLQTAPDTRLRRVLSATYQLRNRGL